MWVLARRFSRMQRASTATACGRKRGARSSAASCRTCITGCTSGCRSVAGNGRLERVTCALREILGLVLADAPHREIRRLRVREIKPRHGRGGKHRVAFGEAHAELACAQAF